WPRRSTASMVPDVPSTARPRAWLKSQAEPRSVSAARTQRHHVSGIAGSPKSVMATAAELRGAPPSSSAAARTPDVPTSIPTTHALIERSPSRAFGRRSEPRAAGRYLRVRFERFQRVAAPFRIVWHCQARTATRLDEAEKRAKRNPHFAERNGT